MKEIIELKESLLQKIENFRLKIKVSKQLFKIIAASVLILIVGIGFYVFSWRSPSPFPDQALVTVERGESLSQIAQSLEDKGIIRSRFWLKTFIFALGGQRDVIAGDYYFPSSVNIFKVADMIHNGEFGLIAKKITIPEGSDSFEIAKILSDNLPAFNSKDFINEVIDNNYEGYLFPDTYFFSPNSKADDVIQMMRENFARQLEPYQSDIINSKKSLNDIVIMASIIEKEANGSLETKRIVSGILWKRLALKMPLQVDAPFVYYNGKDSYTLTKADLTKDNPYNTYTNKGLPPTAIDSPGLDSLRAAIAPTETPYLYFLSDKKGNIYYAKTFDEHQTNRELYLN